MGFTKGVFNGKLRRHIDYDSETGAKNECNTVKLPPRSIEIPSGVVNSLPNVVVPSYINSESNSTSL